MNVIAPWSRISRGIRWRWQFVRADLDDMARCLLRGFPGELGIRLRRRHHGWPTETRVLHGVEIHHADKLRLGENVVIAAGCQLNAAGAITIGNDTLVGPGTFIWSQNHRYETSEAPISEQGYSRRSVEVGDDCWIGCRSVILPGVTLPRGVVVGAGSVVTSSVANTFKPFDVVAGVPAKWIANRHDLRPEPFALAEHATESWR